MSRRRSGNRPLPAHCRGTGQAALAILHHRNAVLDLAEERFTKNLWSQRASAERPQLISVRDEADQARYIVEKVLANRKAGLGLKSQAILFRASHLVAADPQLVWLNRLNTGFVLSAFGLS